MTTLPRPEASPSLSILDKESDAVLVELKESIAGEPLDVILLTFEPGSPEDPQNWSRPYRWYLSLLSCFLVFVTTFASAAPSGYAADLRGQFHMTAELVALTITLFVIGFCFGPLLWGPLSEQFGRRAVLIPCYALFTVGAALSPNSASIMVFRLLGGIFSAAATPIAPALLADIWDPSTREKALTYLGFLSFVGPTLGPLVGGLMAGAHISWQWIFWLLTILFIGGCLYMLFEAYPVVFEEGHHFPSSSLGLAYLPVTAGGVITMVIYLWAFQPYYERKVQQYAPEPIPPEERLLMAVWAAPLFSITFFWFGWTSFPGMNFWAPLMSGLLMGMSTLALIVSLLNYIIDVYVYAAASALGAGTVLRSIFGAIFPLFSAQMFRALNPRWASTLVGCIAVLMIPIPVLLMRYGPVLRAKSRYVA
ncbi:MFS general substrate transporter [Lentinus tigrinus ALCF2SS1-6]|uniref:MFS general substrate transporter n=1 Tax=Lentinus tigrinus ALCF2SS1-6 TaxID=1328759 RepID=A0A5C2SQP2_9APHY|nr:MFS general substrate transporter [Lentinus tigrinus ALCF2SS1-6]